MADSEALGSYRDCQKEGMEDWTLLATVVKERPVEADGGRKVEKDADDLALHRSLYCRRAPPIRGELAKASLPMVLAARPNDSAAARRILNGRLGSVTRVRRLFCVMIGGCRAAERR
jgi:hypothetical protein